MFSTMCAQVLSLYFKLLAYCLKIFVCNKIVLPRIESLWKYLRNFVFYSISSFFNVQAEMRFKYIFNVFVLVEKWKFCLEHWIDIRCIHM